MTGPVISVRDLTVRFGASVAVDSATFSVGKGESFGLVGESGSGKTTVLRVLAGLIRDWTGAASVAGHDLKRQRPRSLARMAQLVFQDPYASLHPLHTVDRVLGEVAAIHRLDNPNERIEAVLLAVGLGPEFRFRFPHQLSGGQRQRVAVARALILEPTILLLDEPTSALDVSVQAEILNLLRRLRAERGLTLLLVTHNLAVVANLCERLAVMRRGRIVETMDAERLRRAEPEQAYTRQLILASRGYDRANAAEIAFETEVG